MKRRLDRAAAIGVGALFVALAAIATVLGGGSPEREDSVESEGEDGRLALFLVLERLGFEPEVWDDPPGLLPPGDHVLWCARAPRSLQEHFGTWELPIPEGDVDPAPDDPAPGDPAPDDPPEEPQPDPRRVPFVLHDLERYAVFVREGGTLVLPAGDETQELLTERLALEELHGVGAREDEPTEVETLIDPGGEELAYHGSARLFEEPDPEAYAEKLVVTDDGRAFALAVAVGAGRVVLLADGELLRNPERGEHEGASARIDGAEHALLAVRLLEELDRGGRLLFDEYALGRWVPDSAAGLAVSGVRGILTLQLVLLLVLLGWRASWVREFPRDPEGLVRLSPLSRARGQAALLERARRYDLLAGMLRRGVLRRMCALARVRATGGEPPVGPAARRDALAAWTRWAEDRLDLVLAAAGEEGARERYRAALFGAAPRNERDLERLAATLDDLERRLARGLGRDDGDAARSPSGMVAGEAARGAVERR